MKSVAFHNLGCKVNSYELDVMQQFLQKEGYEIVDFYQKADIYIINTCTVTNIADRKSRQMIHRAKKQNPDSVVVAVGCYVQTAADQIENDPYIDLAIGNNRKKDIATILMQYLKEHEGEKERAFAEDVIDINHTEEKILSIIREFEMETVDDTDTEYIYIERGQIEMWVRAFKQWKKGFDLAGMFSIGHYNNSESKIIETNVYSTDYWRLSNDMTKQKKLSQNFSGTFFMNYQLNEKHIMGVRYRMLRDPKTSMNGKMYTDNYRNNEIYESSEAGIDLFAQNATHNGNFYYTGQINDWDINLNVDGMWQMAKSKDYTDQIITTALNEKIDENITITTIERDEILFETYPNAILDCKVKISELLGAETNIYTEVAGASVIASVDSRSDLTFDSDVKLVLDMNKCHFFDVESKINIADL